MLVVTSIFINYNQSRFKKKGQKLQNVQENLCIYIYKHDI